MRKQHGHDGVGTGSMRRGQRARTPFPRGIGGSLRSNGVALVSLNSTQRRSCKGSVGCGKVSGGMRRHGLQL